MPPHAGRTPIRQQGRGPQKFRPAFLKGFVGRPPMK